jgi:PLP dependent protein
MGIADNIKKFRDEIDPKVKIIAVSKTKPASSILEAYNGGYRIFGENKVQELVSKYNELPKDIEWHMIGHLQNNKVKYIAPFVSIIHSVDSLDLIKTINKEAQKNKRVIDCLLQVFIAKEETKFGLDHQELVQFLDAPILTGIKNVRICGLMGMATFTDDQSIVRKEFKQLRQTFEFIKEKYFKNEAYFKDISMGMSGDYLIAVEEGSTMVRIGSSIFGQR